MKQNVFCFYGIIFFTISFALVGYCHTPAIESDEEKPDASASQLNNSTLYCFHFTWMGGYFNNRTFKNIKNKTCSQYFKDKKTLCINPMVATFNGGEPSLKYILENHSTTATCRLSQEQVCAKYTVSNSGIVSYVTRYCTQVNINLEGPMRSGCVQERRKNELVEVCACRSEPGPDGICNSARSFIYSTAKSLVTAVTIFVLLWLK